MSVSQRPPAQPCSSDAVLRKTSAASSSPTSTSPPFPRRRRPRPHPLLPPPLRRYPPLRAGRFDVAVDLIAETPIKPDKGVFGALLGACRIHTNANIAELASRSLLELDKENSGRYVVLSNIFLSSCKNTDVDKIRALMKRRGVKKNAEHAVIEA